MGLSDFLSSRPGPPLVKVIVLKVRLKVIIRLLKARLKVLLKVLVRLLKARLKVLLKVLIRLLKARAAKPAFKCF